MIDRLTPPLRLALEAARQGTLTLEQAREAIEAWPALFQHELREKSEALALLCSLRPANAAGDKAPQP
jgi:hypothetical protein